jgi:hypothetical protein
MTPREQVLTKLGLRTHPFWPDRDGQGNPLPEALWKRALDPRADERVRGYYFDVYDWTQSIALVGPLANGKLTSFPLRDDFADHGPALVLISSKEGQTGRTSLANLALGTIEAVESEKPLVVEVRFVAVTRDSIALMAKRFIDELIDRCPAAAAQDEQLWKHYDRDIGEATSSEDAFFTGLFTWLRGIVKKCGDPAVVFVITNSDSYDDWACAYNSCAGLADYLIVQTSKPDAAKSCLKLPLLKGKPAAHIEAQTLDLARATEYVRIRLAAERPAPAEDPLSPFTTGALAALYEPGSDPAAAKKVDGRAITWLRNTLKQALLDHLDALEEKVVAQGAAVLDALSAKELAIDRDKVLRSREKLNHPPGVA